MVLFVDNHNQSTVHDDENHVHPIVAQQVHVDDNPADCIRQREVMALRSK